MPKRDRVAELKRRVLAAKKARRVYKRLLKVRSGGKP